MYVQNPHPLQLTWPPPVKSSAVPLLLQNAVVSRILSTFQRVIMDLQAQQKTLNHPATTFRERLWWEGKVKQSTWAVCRQRKAADTCWTPLSTCYIPSWLKWWIQPVTWLGQSCLCVCVFGMVYLSTGTHKRKYSHIITSLSPLLHNKCVLISGVPRALGHILRRWPKEKRKIIKVLCNNPIKS